MLKGNQFVITVVGNLLLPTPRVPTRIPNTSASRAFCTAAYRRMRRRFVRTDSRRAVLVCGLKE